MDENSTSVNDEPVLGHPTPPEPTSAPQPESPIEPASIPPSSQIATPKKANKTLLIVLIIILLTVIGIGVYFLLNQPKNIPTPEEQNSSEEPNNQDNDRPVEIPDDGSPNDTNNDAETVFNTSELRDTPLGTLNCQISNIQIEYCDIPNEQVINAREGYRYYLEEFTETIAYSKYATEAADISINETNQNEVNIVFHDTLISAAYGTSLVSLHNIKPEAPFTLSFPENIKKLKVVGFGQASGHEYLFFITESGNLWYIKYSEFANAAPAPQQLIEISDIIAIYDGSTHDDIGGWHDAYAVRSDKKVYQLEQYIPF